ncbi:SAM-dependent DNA methyltransferase [Labilibacter sediminis]|nr:SAM-dependent DNA methyltransferase [Labilibacter sediminis]
MKEFEKLFSKIAYRHTFMNVFDDFLTLTLCAFGMGRYEEEYLKTLEIYSKEEINIFPQLLGELVKYYTENSKSGSWVDGLGDFFMEHNGKFGRDARGQFFTPVHICQLLAEMTKPESGTINDCAVGSGRCLIAADRVHPQNRFNNFYVGVDVDPRCVKMCAINMQLYGMKGVVIHGNSLTLDIWGGYRVYLPETGLGVRKLSADECRQYLLTQKDAEPKKQAHKKEIPTPQPQKTTEQLRLFEILTS